MTGKEMVRLLQQNGWIIDRISKSSHHRMIKGSTFVIVPVHGKKELKKGLQEKLLKEAGLK